MTDLCERRLRTDGDSWDITESVGATALGVAAARAAMDGAFVHARVEGDAR
jgi:hypothetical protein